ncbi:MAG: BON domain-containing protein [Acidobacteria bacterium]|jgi:osmotically-inducible protein OsmY|nr:BON domain-containing protein [Acidobacteriota bacterium]MBA4183441.1 BON domain-containing protein [Acidobacteriota bacterium]
MTNKLNCKTLIAVFSLILIFSIGTLAQTDSDKSKNNKNKKPDCSQVSGADTVKAIYDKIKVKYAGQIRHINVTIKDNVVTLQGWATTKGVRKEIEKYAKKTNCVKKEVVNKLTIGVSGGCGPGQKQCGDICINEKEDCNITNEN